MVGAWPPEWSVHLESEAQEHLSPVEGQLAAQAGGQDPAVVRVPVVLVLHADADVPREVPVGGHAPVLDRGVAVLRLDLDVEEVAAHNESLRQPALGVAADGARDAAGALARVEAPALLAARAADGAGGLDVGLHPEVPDSDRGADLEAGVPEDREAVVTPEDVAAAGAGRA